MMIRVHFHAPDCEVIELNDEQTGLWNDYVNSQDTREGWSAYDRFLDSIWDDVDSPDLIDKVEEY